MAAFDFDEHKKKARWFWFFALSVVWMIWIIGQANAAYDKAAAETATKTGLAHWWSNGAGVLNSDADNARMSVIMGGVFGLVLVFIAAHFIAGFQASTLQSTADAKVAAQRRREQRAFENQIKTLDEESNTQASLSKAAQSKQELIMRLGSIDQFIRVLGIEKSDAKRTVALQAAHSEMTTLAAKLASGQISRDAIADPDVQEQARETSTDLTRLGLADDRLNRDITRIFQLSQK